MNCTKHKPEGKGGCQKGLVTQAGCNRKAVAVRRTANGTNIKLCKKCNAEFGNVVGIQIKEETYLLIHHTADPNRAGRMMADLFLEIKAFGDAEALVKAHEKMHTGGFDHVFLSKRIGNKVTRRVATIHNS